MISGVLVFLLVINLINAGNTGTKPSQCSYQYTSMGNAARYAIDAGFDRNNAIIAVAVAWAESSGNINACLYNPGSNSWDRGILQINNYYHSEVTDKQAFDPKQAFIETKRISKGSNFKEWYGYIYGTYKNYLSQSTNAVDSVLKCKDQCLLGQTRCSLWNIKQTCILSNGCYVWGGDVSCTKGCYYGQCK